MTVPPAPPAALGAPAALVRWLPALFFASFSVIGATIPYLPLELGARGITGVQLAVALGVLPLGRLLAGPAWAYVADRFQAAGRVTRGTALVAALGSAMLLWAQGWWAVLAVLAFSIGRAPMGPLFDGMALRGLGGDRLGYGRLRRWGSLGFLVAVLVAGVVHDHTSVSPLALALGAALGLAALTWLLPAPDKMQRVPVWPALVSLGRDPVMPWLLVAASLHFAAHVGSTSFLAVHMEALGIPSGTTGIAQAVGVAVEILVMTRGSWLMARFSPQAVFLFAVLLAVPRWLVTAQVDTAAALVALQSLHGVTFGAFWIAGVELVARRAPPEITTSAQGLFAASIGGVGAMLGMVGASLLVDAVDTRALFTAGAAVAAVASVAATVAVVRIRA